MNTLDLDAESPLQWPQHQHTHDGSDGNSPFAIPDLWRKSAFTLPEAPEGNLFRDACGDVLMFRGLDEEEEARNKKRRRKQRRGKKREGGEQEEERLGLGGLGGLGEEEGGEEAAAAAAGTWQLEDLGIPIDLEMGMESADAEAEEDDDDDDDDGAEREQANTDQQIKDEDVWQLSMNTIPEQPKLRTWEAFMAEETETQTTAERGEQRKKRKEEEEETAEDISDESESVVFISEAGAQVFDTALDRAAAAARGKTATTAGEVLQSAFFLKCLGLLGMGRSSALFQWEANKNINGKPATAAAAAFSQTIPNVRLSGVSLLAAKNVIRELGAIGSLFVELRMFVEKTYTSKHALATLVALSRCVQVIIEALEQELTTRIPFTTGVLQLVEHFDAVGVVLRELSEFVRVSRTTTNKAKSDRMVIGAVQQKVHHFARACSPYHHVHLHILDRVSRPWVQEVGRRVGLLQGEPGFEDSESFMVEPASSEDEHLIDELATAIDILRDACPDHPLLTPASWAVEMPDLTHSAVDVDAVAVLDKARRYEVDLMQAIAMYSSGAQPVLVKSSELSIASSSREEDMAWQVDEQQQAYFTQIADQFSQPPGHSLNALHPLPEELRTLVLAAFQNINNQQAYPTADDTVFADLDRRHKIDSPLLPLRPFLHAQSRLLNGTVMRLVFRHHRLRTHLDVNHAFHLFGNAAFTQRLATALFSSSASTAQRRTGHVIGGDGESLGLRLDARRTWPPGGSELRLALMGILSESYHRSDGGNSSSSSRSHSANKELPGNLSFSVRDDLDNDADIERILDPYSIHALDFLRLSYQPPSPLDKLLFTEKSLRHYDDVFRCILRVLRMLHVVTVMKRFVVCGSGDETAAAMATAKAKAKAKGEVKARKELQAFTNEAHHFVTTLSSYMFDVGVAEPWKRFTCSLDRVEREMGVEDAAAAALQGPAKDGKTEREEEGGEGGYGSVVTLDLSSLVALHASTLDSIRTRLFLRRLHHSRRHHYDQQQQQQQQQQNIGNNNNNNSSSGSKDPTACLEAIFSRILDVWRLRVQVGFRDCETATATATAAAAGSDIDNSDGGKNDLCTLRRQITAFLTLLSEMSGRKRDKKEEEERRRRRRRHNKKNNVGGSSSSEKNKNSGGGGGGGRRREEEDSDAFEMLRCRLDWCGFYNNGGEDAD